MSVAVRLGRLLSWVLAVRREAMQLLVSSTSSSGQVGASDAAGIEVGKGWRPAVAQVQAHRRIGEERSSSLRRIYARNTVALGLIVAGQRIREAHGNTRRFALPGMFQ